MQHNFAHRTSSSQNGSTSIRYAAPSDLKVSLDPNSKLKPVKSRWSPRLEPRYQIVALTFLATLTAYVERVGFSIAFTEMAKSAGLDEAKKGTVLSAFYWGYALSQIPGGWAAQLYGGRLMLIICFFLWSIASFLTTTDAKNILLMILARVSVGVAQGFLIPAVHTVLAQVVSLHHSLLGPVCLSTSMIVLLLNWNILDIFRTVVTMYELRRLIVRDMQWIPPHERARATSLTTSGMYLGSAAAMLVLPSVAKTFGAPILLKVVAFQGFTWLVLWIVFGKDIPHRETVIPLTVGDSGSSKAAAAKGRPGPTPWSRMMASSAVWAIVINNFSFHYAFYVVMNWLPTYFNSVLKVDLASLGGLKTLPYLAMFLMSNIGGWAGDYLILTQKYSVASGRKAVNTIGFVASAGALMLMPAASGVGLGLVATTLTLSTLGFSRGGFSVNHMDIAPKYAGVVMGISNTAGTVSGVIGVWLTGVILNLYGGADHLGGWFLAHAVAAVICGVAMLVFNAFAKGERQFD